MSMKALLAVLDHRPSNRSLLETACAFGSHWQAKLEVLLPYPGIWNPELMSVADETTRDRIQQVVAQVRSHEESFLGKSRQEFDKCCRRFRIPVTSEDTTPPPSARWDAYTDFDRGCRVVRHARLADLVFVRRPVADSGTGYEDLINQILDGSGRPILLVPPRPAAADCGRIAIAWKGSAESVRAVVAALDLIGAAEAVDIVVAESVRTPGSAGRQLGAYLACHGIRATPHVLTDRRNRSAGEAILDKCADLKSDLLVMGAYSHPRLQERVFGGVTHHVMAHAELPVLMAR
jgi:nucleotide-binding universal stress UspA family protein